MTSSNGNIFRRYWTFMRGIHRSTGKFLHKCQWRGALVFSLICAWTNGWVNNRGAGDLRRHCAHYDVTLMNNFHCLNPNIFMKHWTRIVVILTTCSSLATQKLSFGTTSNENVLKITTFPFLGMKCMQKYWLPVQNGSYLSRDHNVTPMKKVLTTSRWVCWRCSCGSGRGRGGGGCGCGCWRGGSCGRCLWEWRGRGRGSTAPRYGGAISGETAALTVSAVAVEATAGI